jgi:hypothetical protein
MSERQISYSNIVRWPNQLYLTSIGSYIAIKYLPWCKLERAARYKCRATRSRSVKQSNLANPIKLGLNAATICGVDMHISKIGTGKDFVMNPRGG